MPRLRSVLERDAFWVAAFRAWLLLILLSQTGLAGELSDRLSEWLFGSLGANAATASTVSQKLYHVVEFSVLGLLTTLPRGYRSLARCRLWCVGFGLFAEALQMLSPFRTPAWADAALNVTAALAGLALARRLGRAVFGHSGRP